MERDGRAAARRPADPRGARAPRELREWLTEEFRRDQVARDATAQAIFEELGLEAGGARRQLLESDRFRALLVEEPATVAEAAWALRGSQNRSRRVWESRLAATEASARIVRF